MKNFYKLKQLQHDNEGEWCIVIGPKGLGKKICMLEWMINLHIFDEEVEKELKEIVEILKEK